jgi:hypothetical protein
LLIPSLTIKYRVTSRYYKMGQMHPFLMETKSDNGWEFVHKMFNKMYAFSEKKT